MPETIMTDGLVDCLQKTHYDLLFHEDTLNLMFMFFESEYEECLSDLIETA